MCISAIIFQEKHLTTWHRFRNLRLAVRVRLRHASYRLTCNVKRLQRGVNVPRFHNRKCYATADSGGEHNVRLRVLLHHIYFRYPE
ncbi:hypothetical protein EVAR_39171_1 [Eumeta japonica]|uniref:Uncharacterized protein n=1 Tax=Eumeta variegata TaxID=151549 RepID=A0A4C1VMM1_EUMVA|nr:hypothetical protein EVAR_39171_1 [Eumeta japonica]